MAVLGIGAEAALLDHDRLLVLRVQAEAADAVELLGQHVDGAVDSDAGDVIVGVERAVDAAHADEGAEAADADLDGFAALRMHADEAGQG